MEAARRQTGVELDTTYTTKVFAYLQALAAAKKLQGQDVLYWHTYSPAAMHATAKMPPSNTLDGNLKMVADRVTA